MNSKLKSRVAHWKSSVKRSMDIIVSLFLLVLTSPFFLIIAVLIKLDSKGPVFYSQLRIGLNRRRPRRGSDRSVVPMVPDAARELNRRKQIYFGKPFYILKFRTMHVDAESQGRAQWCLEDDPRVTRVGYVLRKTHLDELPQLFNILTGEMSLVGPRPERPEFIHKLREVVPNYDVRLDMKPGLTGLAQIRHRSDVSLSDVKKKIRYDLLYSKNAGVVSDIKIIVGTVPLVFGAPVKYDRVINKGLVKNSIGKNVMTLVRSMGLW